MLFDRTVTTEWFYRFTVSVKQSFIENYFWGSPLIDDDGYRPNIGIVICNREARLCGRALWILTRGSSRRALIGESARRTKCIGIVRRVWVRVVKDVRILASTRNWLRYKLPKRLVRLGHKNRFCIGQKQKWFLPPVDRQRCGNQYANQ